MSSPKSHLQHYLNQWRRAGSEASEAHLCALFREHILRGVLGYQGEDVLIQPRQTEAGRRGWPDLQARAGDGSRWLRVEGKTDDDLLRKEAKRRELWRDKQKYITPETAYFMWVAPHTIILCEVDGTPIADLRLDAVPLSFDDTPTKQARLITEDEELAKALAEVDVRAATELLHLDRFRRGEVPAGHLKVESSNVRLFAETLDRVGAILREYLETRWRDLQGEYPEFTAEQEKLRELEGDASWSDSVRRSLPRLRRKLRDRYAEAIAVHDAFELFCQEQAYTGFHRERNESEELALQRIFRVNASYVILGRLLFVRLAEDHGLIQPKISNGGLKFWYQICGELDMLDELVRVAFQDTRRIWRQLFEPTPFDALLHSPDVGFDRALQRVLYQLNAFDLSELAHEADVLGAIYQGVLPRKLRKELGEFYTDEEIVEYLLRRSGFAEKAGSGASLLDPACGSGAFLVQAAGLVRRGTEARNLGPDAALSAVRDAVHGLDINHFAVYISQMNLLFSVFDLAARLKSPVAFPVHCANSLARDIVSAEIETQVSPGGNGDGVRAGSYDFVVGNPPYVRGERLPEVDRDDLRQDYPSAGAGNINLFNYFILRAQDWLKPDGVFAMIVPRALSDAAYAAPLRGALAAPDVTVEELVPLDWVCRDLFDSDVVPMLIIFRKAPRPRNHKVRLVQGIRTKQQLLSVARAGRAEGVRVSRVPWADFALLSTEGWALEITPEDVPVLKKLLGARRLGEVADARYGVKAGTGTEVIEIEPGGAAPEGYLPMIGGADIHSFMTDPPRRAIRIEEAADRSWWGEGAVGHAQLAAVALIHVTANASLLSSWYDCAQDTTILLRSKEPASWNMAAVTALINTCATRYFLFLALRSGITGGGRRDLHVYPRTLTALPLPDLDDARLLRLSRLSRLAHGWAERAATRSRRAWAEITADLTRPERLAQWQVDFTGWPLDFVITEAPELTVTKRGNKHRLTAQGTVYVEGDRDALVFLQHELPRIMYSRTRLDSNELQMLPVPAYPEAVVAVQRFEGRLEEVTPAQERFLDILHRIDEVVETGLGLTEEEREIVHRRMSEFPLSETANRPRLPWETTVSPSLKQFRNGERFHES